MRCSSLRFSRITAEEVDFTGQGEKSSGDENVTPNRCSFASDIQYVGFKTSATRPMCLASNDKDSFTQNFTVTVNGQSHPLTTTIGIQRGRFNGTHEVNSTITKP